MADPLERLEALVARPEQMPALRAPDGLVLRDGPTLEFDVNEMPTLEQLERSYIAFVLSNCAGNKTKAADILGIDPSTLYRKLDRSK